MLSAVKTLRRYSLKPGIRAGSNMGQKVPTVNYFQYVYLHHKCVGIWNNGASPSSRVRHSGKQDGRYIKL